MALSPRSLDRPQSLFQQTYQALFRAILTGEISAGERLIETSLAEKLQVSRTPIREALRQLQRDALVIADPSGGLRVATLSVADASHLYDCRIALEQLSVAGACAQATSDQLRQLEACITQADQALDQEDSPQDPINLLSLDYQFHRLLAESSGNRWLVTLLDQVFAQMALLRMQTTRHNPRVLEIRVEHRRIYDAIAHRDPTTATQMIQAHLTASKHRVIQEVQAMQM